MVDSMMNRDPAPLAGGGDALLAVALETVERLVRSAEPAVVFSSLVRLCAPTICESATATISGSDQEVYAVSWPRDAVDHHRRSQGTNVITPFDAPGTGEFPSYRGVVSMQFEGQDSATPFLAQLLVDRALATVERQRLAESVTRQQAVVENLEVALTSNREIGVAVGIVMSTLSLGAASAFELLRHVSQHTNTKLHAIALEVTLRGRLDVPPGMPLPENGASRA